MYYHCSYVKWDFLWIKISEYRVYIATTGEYMEELFSYHYVGQAVHVHLLLNTNNNNKNTSFTYLSHVAIRENLLHIN